MNTAGVLAAGAAGGDLFVAQNVFFGAIALVMIVSAIRCVTTRNVVHAALWLVLVLAGAAGQFILLGSEFVAVTQVLVYIGAIVVLFLFGIMLTKASMGDDEAVSGEKRLMAGLVAVLLAVVMGIALLDSYSDTRLRDRRAPALSQPCPTPSSASTSWPSRRSRYCCWPP